MPDRSAPASHVPPLRQCSPKLADQRDSRFRTTLPRLRNRLFADNEGSVTIQNVIWAVICLAIGGLAIDGAHAWRVKSMLRAAAEAGAHAGAAAMTRNSLVDPLLTPDLDPTTVAIEQVERNLTNPRFRNTLTPRDVEFGTWDRDSASFTPNALGGDAIRVTLRRDRTNGNPLPTNFLRLIGVDLWDIRVQAVARTVETRRAECIDPLLSLRTRADVENVDAFVGLCLHAQADVEVVENGAWLPDQVADIVDSVFASAILNQAADTGPIVDTVDGLLGNLDLIDEVAATLTASLHDLLLTDAQASSALADLVAGADVTTTLDLFEFADVQANQTVHVSCHADEVLAIPADVALPGVTLLSDCPVKVQEGANLSSTIVISNLWSILDLQLSGALPGALAVGSDRDCGPGAGVRILIFIDVVAAGRLELFDLAPFSDLLLAAELSRDADVDGDGAISAILDVSGELAGDVLLDELAGICLGARFMIETRAIALAE